MKKPSRSFADYAAIAACPMLIMLAVGSLVFFLIDLGYGGSHAFELRWTMFWFVLAMVLVSRIAIEKGYGTAGIYGICLAAATALMLMRFAAMNWIVWLLLALIWWATNKLTWDSTVIDDDADASGEGLLQSAGLTHHPRATAEVVSPPPAARPIRPGWPTPPRAPTLNPRRLAPKPPVRSPAWQRWLGKTPTAAKQPHAPGLWVL